MLARCSVGSTGSDVRRVPAEYARKPGAAVVVEWVLATTSRVHGEHLSVVL